MTLAKLKNRIFDTRQDVEQSSGVPRDRNRLWWERMPMTYAAWDSPSRLPRGNEDYPAIEAYLLARSPFLTEFFAAADFTNRTVLDLGCGVGVLSCLLARRGAIVTAADITERAVGLAARNAAVQKLSVRIARTDAEAMCFADASFDFVLSWGVIHHSPRTEQAIAEIARILKPGGRGLIMVYNRVSFAYYLRGLYWLVARGKLLRGYTLRSVQDFFVDGYYHRHFSKAELAGCLRAAGLEPTRVVATQQDAPLIPALRGRLDRALKSRFGWYLVAEIRRPT